MARRAAAVALCTARFTSRALVAQPAPKTLRLAVGGVEAGLARMPREKEDVPLLVRLPREERSGVLPLTGGASPALHALGGALVSAGLSLAIAVVYSFARNRQGFGMGDVKLLAAIGLFLGFYGVLVLFVASVIGAVFGIVAGARSSEGLAAKIPFGPFLAFGAVLVAAWG